MTGKITKIGLALLIAAGSLSTVAIHAADSPETVAKRKLQREIDRRRNDARDAMYNHIRGAKRIDGGGESGMDFNGSIVNEKGFGGTGNLNSSMPPPAPSPGISIGKSSYDYQHNQSQGHQIGHVPGTSIVHFIWMAWDIIPLSPDEDSRFVAYSSYTKVGNGGSLNQPFGGVFLSDNDERGGYTNLSYNEDNQAQVWLHKRQLVSAPYHTWHYDFPFPGSAGFNPPIELGGTEPACTEVLWPHGDAARDVGSAGVPLHVVSHDGNNCGRDLIWYWRYDGTNWVGPVIVDSNGALSYVVCDDPNSNKAAIAISTDREAQFNTLNNIAYYQSATSGLGWISGAELGDVNKVLLTSYSDDGNPTTADAQSWLHISAAYDGAGSLHIVWDEQREANLSSDITIRHWRDAVGGGPGAGLIRPVAQGFWPSPLASGAFNLNLAKVTMGIGDGATRCPDAGGTNANYVYVSYTQYAGLSAAEQDDASLEGLYNGEIYLTASNSRGNTWSPPVNLTNTKTPNCNPGPGAPGAAGDPPRPDSVCRSEAWGTITKNVRDIDILFVSDLDAGGIPQGEGNWQQNPIHYLRFPGGSANPQALHVCPVIAPNFEASLTAQSECEYHATPAGNNVETMTISNFGNADLTGNASVTTDFPGAPTLVLQSPGVYTIVAGNADITKSVTMNSNGAAQGLYSGQISITHNDGAEPSPRNFPIDFFVFTNFFCPDDEVLKAGVASPGSLALEVASNARFASQNAEGGLWRHKDSSSSFFDASLIAAHGTQGPDTTVFIRFFDRETNGQFGWRAQGDLTVDTTAYGTNTGFATATAKMSSADSVIGVTVKWYFPQNASRDEIVIAHYRVYRHNNSVAVNDMAIGVLIDADINPASALGNLQSGVDNAPGIDGAIGKNLIWQVGVDTTGHPATNYNTASRFRGGVSTQCSFMGARVGNTPDDLQDGGGPTDGFLYNALQTLVGVDQFSDSTVDLYQIVSMDRDEDIGVGETLNYALVFASDTTQGAGGEAAFKAKIDTGIVIVQQLNLCGCSCPCKADPQCDGVATVLDVTKVINAAFRGLPSTTDAGCPRDREDVDANGVANVLDVSKTINVAFRGQCAFCPANFVDPCL